MDQPEAKKDVVNVKVNKNMIICVLAVALVLVSIAAICSSYKGWRGDRYEMGVYKTSRGMMHKMPDGSMMNNVGMDMGSMMDGMMSGLQGKTGDTFDKEFLSQMIVHHAGAVEMAKAVLATSKRPELIKLANDIISAQTKEIKMMQDWQEAWFK